MSTTKILFQVSGIMILSGLIVGFLASFSQDFSEFFLGTFFQIRMIVILGGLASMMIVAMIPGKLYLVSRVSLMAVMFLFGVLLGGMI